MAVFTANHWMGPSEGVLVKENTSRYPSLLHIEIRSNGDRVNHTTISNADAHKLADWIKENIQEPPPAPPEWRIDTSDGEAALRVDEQLMVWINKSGEFCGDNAGDFSKKLNPDLHKEMICALLDAHYELNKGES